MAEVAEHDSWASDGSEGRAISAEPRAFPRGTVGTPEPRVLKPGASSFAPGNRGAALSRPLRRTEARRVERRCSRAAPVGRRCRDRFERLTLQSSKPVREAASFDEYPPGTRESDDYPLDFKHLRVSRSSFGPNPMRGMFRAQDRTTTVRQMTSSVVAEILLRQIGIHCPRSEPRRRPRESLRVYPEALVATSPMTGVCVQLPSTTGTCSTTTR